MGIQGQLTVRSNVTLCALIVTRWADGSMAMSQTGERALACLTAAVRTHTVLLHGRAHAIGLGLTNLDGRRPTGLE